MRRLRRVGWAGMVLLAVAGAYAAEEAFITIRGAQFGRELTVGDQPLVLKGAGVLRYKRIVPVYVAALYVAPQSAGQDVLGTVAKRLEVEYLVKADARDFNEAGERILKASLTPAAYADLRVRIEQIQALYPNPVPRDRCALTYQPGAGTELRYNGRVLGVIPGDDFQRAYFGIWLGSEPASVALRTALLGSEQE
ncbi:MAG: chalcone isomerase family protein [Lentisphaerae bacterium]|nr:chalcone isomerase family protein [Lentisphaerota bacterium]